MANLLDLARIKNETRTSEETQKLIATINAELQEKFGLDEDISVQLAALLSLAVDNAKDLALEKLNSNSTMLGVYAYGLTIGCDLETLIGIINSPQGRLISKLAQSNLFNKENGAGNAVNAIKKLNGNIQSTIMEFNDFVPYKFGKPDTFVRDSVTGQWYGTIMDVMHYALREPVTRYLANTKDDLKKNLLKRLRISDENNMTLA